MVFSGVCLCGDEMYHGTAWDQRAEQNLLMLIQVDFHLDARVHAGSKRLKDHSLGGFCCRKSVAASATETLGNLPFIAKPQLRIWMLI